MTKDSCRSDVNSRRTGCTARRRSQEEASDQRELSVASAAAGDDWQGEQCSLFGGKNSNDHHGLPFVSAAASLSEIFIAGDV